MVSQSHSAESQKLSSHCHSLPQAPLFSLFTPLPKHHVFHSVSISLMFRTSCPFRSPQTSPLLPEPMKYLEAIPLPSCSANAAVLAAYGLQNLPAPAVFCINICSEKQLANFIRNNKANNNPHCALFSALFKAISS